MEGQGILMKKRTQNENEENLLLESDKPTTSSFVQRTMLILEVLSGKEKGLVEIASETGLSKSTIYRILVSLVNLDYAYKVAETEKYGLTLKFNKLADSNRGRFNLVSLSLDILQRIADASQETVFLYTFSHNQLIILHQIESPYPLRVVSKFNNDGKRPPLHATASSKCIIAMQGEKSSQYLLSLAPYPRFTDTTICTREAMQEELSRIRELGYAMDDQENEPGIRCVAAPIYMPDNSVTSCVSISGPSVRMNGEKLSKCIDLVKEATAEISRKIGATNQK